MNAINNSGNTIGIQINKEMIQLVEKIESSILKRIPINGSCDTFKLKTDLIGMFNNEKAIDYAFHNLIRKDIL